MTEISATDTFLQQQRMLRRLAYRMLGSVSLAEDAVQETWLRWHAIDPACIDVPQAWLVTTLSRICIDELRSARHQRELYASPWLPEPLASDDCANPATAAERHSDISMAFLLLLERLSPEERVAFLLQEIFDNDYRNIARIMDKSEAACRQLVHRARERLRQDKPRFQADATRRQELLQLFAGALFSSDARALLSALAPDVTLISDGGGKVKAASKPVHGSRVVSRLLLGTRKLQAADSYILFQEINGEPGIAGYHVDGTLYFVMQFAVDQQNGICGVYIVNNPDKLAAMAAGWLRG